MVWRWGPAIERRLVAYRGGACGQRPARRPAAEKRTSSSYLGFGLAGAICSGDDGLPTNVRRCAVARGEGSEQ
jgi:hypothetical protein